MTLLATPDEKPRPPAVPLGALRRTVREVGLALVTAGVVILAFVTYQLFGTNLTEARHQASLSRRFGQALALSRSAISAHDPALVGAAPGNLSPSTPTGVAVDHLVIPSIGVDKYVVQGTAESDLTQGPGHYLGTPFPGQPGNAAIAGHRTTYGAPFFRLDELHRGDLILVTDTAGQTFDYRVVGSSVVAPTDVSVLNPTTATTLTLTTCNPVYSATSRLIVVAHLVGKPLPPPVSTGSATLRPVAATPRPVAATLGSGHASAWPSALAYGAAAVVAWILTRLVIARSRRWRRAGVLVGGIGVCCVPLWFCFESVVRLLPSSI